MTDRPCAPRHERLAANTGRRFGHPTCASLLLLITLPVAAAASSAGAAVIRFIDGREVEADWGGVGDDGLVRLLVDGSQTAARVDGPFAMSWPAGGPWQPVV